MTLLDVERPKVVETVSWAAKNGDRSENGDYLYGKKRLREIDRRIRFLTKRLDIAEVADPSRAPRQRPGLLRRHGDLRQRRGRGAHGHHQGHRRGRQPAHGEVSWIAPIARALLKAREGDEVQLVTPGVERIEVLAVRYPPRSLNRA
jgi:transcription elongation factor GreB